MHAKATANLYVELYPWYPMSPSVHKMLVYGKDFIKHAPVPIGPLSEEAQEALNKYLRQYRTRHAKKCSRKDKV